MGRWLELENTLVDRLLAQLGLVRLKHYKRISRRYERVMGRYAYVVDAANQLAMEYRESKIEEVE